jgi:hypothetical protein
LNSVVALLGRLQGVLGKTFLLAGLMPALLLLLGWTWFCGGEARVRALFTEVAYTRPKAEAKHTKEPRKLNEAVNPTKDQPETDPSGDEATRPRPLMQTVGTVAYRVALILGLGLVFFAARHLLLRFFTSLPYVPPLHWLSMWYQDWRWMRARRSQMRAAWKMTILMWPTRGPFTRPKAVNLPPEAPLGDLRDAEYYRNAIRKWAGAPMERLPSAWILRALFLGLESVYVCMARGTGTPKIQEEMIEWWQLFTNENLNAIGSQEQFSDPSTYEHLQQLLKYAQVNAKREEVRAALALDRFPDPEWMMPTRLGNALASLDDYAESRYGLDTTALWLRLWGVLSKEERKEVADAQATVETMINLCVALGVLALMIGIGSLVGAAGGWHWWDREIPALQSAAFAAVAFSLAAMCYWGAVFAVGTYAEHVIRCIDLHRLKLFGTMGFKLPKNVEKERDSLKQLGKFFNDGASLPAHWRLVEPAKELAQPAESEEKKRGEETKTSAKRANDEAESNDAEEPEPADDESRDDAKETDGF